MTSDQWSNLLTTDMDKLFVGKYQKKVEKIKLKKGERRNVSVLFLDIKGFTAMSEKLDPEEVTHIIDNVFKVLTAEIIRYGGMVDKYIGDCIMALFGAKKASEDDAERAIRAGLGMIERMDQVNVILAEKDLKLGCRVGINTGLVVAGEMGGDDEKDFTVMGDTVNTASRLETAAEVNTILVSKSTRSSAGDFFDYESLEPIQVKGKSKPLKVFRVHGVLKDRVERWERDSLAKSKKYVGRGGEWSEFGPYLEKALSASAESQAGVVGLRADGGMGKSRMVYEYLQRGECPRGLILKGKTISYTSAPYWLFISLIKNMLGVQEGDPAEVVRQKWEAILKRLLRFERLPEKERGDKAEELSEEEDYLAFLLGVARETDRIKSIEPDKLKKAIFESFRIFLEAAGAEGDDNEVVYIVLDDLHWIDELSQELIDYLMDELKPVRPCAIVGMFRPDFQESSKWKKGENYHEVQIKPLNIDETTEMVEGMLTGLQLTDELKQLIFNKSSGNPFYIEEISYSLIDQQVLIQNDEIQPGNPIWIVDKTAEEVELPDTIHGMVQTRIDKLDEQVRVLLQEASVIGMEFGVEALTDLHRKIDDSVEDLSDLLTECRNARMAYPKPSADETVQEGKEIYVFSNTLIVEVCYNTLLNYNKTLLHGLLGECIEEMYGGREKVPEDEHHRLAFHFEKGEKADKAIPYLESSADQCGIQFSNKAAIDSYHSLLDMLEKSELDSSEVEELRMRNIYKLAHIEYRMGLLDTAYSDFAECCKISQSRNDISMLCKALTRAGEIDRIRERPEKAMAFFRKSLELAEKLGNDFFRADNLVNIGIVIEEKGDYTEAMEYFQKALGLATTDEQRQNISHYIFERG
jgi:class 3 adenylate cyclase/predicted ATPase